MRTSERLDPKTEGLIRRLAKQRGQTKSEVIHAAIEALAGGWRTLRGGAALSAYDRVAHVVGIADSGGAGLSTRTGERFRDTLIKGKGARGRRSG